MFLRLGALTVALDSPSPVLRSHWRYLFGRWLSASAASRPNASGGVIKFRLTVAPTLPPPPKSPPVYHDPLVDVYLPDPGTFTIYFAAGAATTVRLPSGAEACGSVSGITLPALMEHDHLHDVIFTSVAPLLRRRDHFLMHAFGASRGGEATLLIGPSGSGKTTGGLSLVLGGWKLLANDSLLLVRRPDRVYALPTPGRLRIRPHTFQLLPALQNNAMSRATELEEHVWGAAAPVCSLHFPTVGRQRRSTVQPLPSAVCLARLIEESVDRWDQETFPAHLALLDQLSRQAPAYALTLGQDVAQLPQRLEREML
ncbi:MAG: hypothetical protein R3272_00295 [Candidatus Promineifilaceae bacterium]|nr:hypothetical protein [Candidatus Promineifilaceae bacterium]